MRIPEGAEALAKEQGTPLYVMDLDRVRENYRRVKAAFEKEYPNLRVYYACKANTSLAVLRALEEEGAFADTVSPGEIFLCKKAGFAGERLSYTATSVRTDELEYAVDAGALVTIDSISELDRLIRLGKKARLAFRINPEIGAGHHEHCITAGKGVKFGLSEGELSGACGKAAKAGLKIEGLHMHIGSGINEAGPYLLAMEKLLAAAGETGVKFEQITIGGGIGVPYKPEEKEVELGKFARELVEAFKRGLEKHSLGQPRLAIEPGRYIVADAGVLLTRVNTIKKPFGRKYAGVDAGFNTLIRHAMYGSYHEIVKIGKNSGEKEEITIAGPLCESGDVFGTRKMPKLGEGDLLAIGNAGAYGFAMSSRYNSRPLPAEVSIEKGKARLTRKREGLEELARAQESGLEFFKMQATGNDYALVDELDGEKVPEGEKPGLARKICDRHMSIGADGVLFVQKPEKADAKFRIFNPDGTEAEMCGNGMRCFARYLHENRMRKERYKIETKAGVKEAELTKDGIRVDMGRPSLEPGEIGLASGKRLVNGELRGEKHRITAVSMGNPHAIVRVEDVDRVDAEKEGRRIRDNMEFKRGANVTFYQKTGENKIKVRTFERGVEGETLSCGTGSTACAVAATLLGDCEKGKPVLIETRGGKLVAEIAFEGEKPSRAYLAGPAEKAFRGDLNEES